MNKLELARELSNKTDLQLCQCKDTINILIQIIEHSVVDGERVILAGFGTFERRKRDARQGRNPRTGEVVPIPECYYPTFNPGKEFKDKVKKAFTKETVLLTSTLCDTKIDQADSNSVCQTANSLSDEVPIGKVTKTNRKSKSKIIIADK